MKIIKLLSILILLPILSIAQSYDVPQSFKHLNKTEIDKKGNIYLFTSQNIDTNVYEIKKKFIALENWFTQPICITSIDGNKNNKVLVCFNFGPSYDPSFEFFKLIDGNYKMIFSLSGEQLFIPSNGNLYISGITNNMFDVKRKFKYKNDKIVEVKQPYYYVGQNTVTLKSIKLYTDKNCTTVLAVLPANAKIEIIAASVANDLNIENKSIYLIKSSFGLLGWWKLDNYASEKIKDLYFHGD